MRTPPGGPQRDAAVLFYFFARCESSGLGQTPHRVTTAAESSYLRPRRLLFATLSPLLRQAVSYPAVHPIAGRWAVTWQEEASTVGA